MDENKNIEEIEKTKQVYAELTDLYLLEELYAFCRASTGIAITIAYITLILTSMMYLYFFYDIFNINIIKYVTFEDILATPVKNPFIIFVFLLCTGILIFADAGNRYRARQKIKYAGKEKPLFFKITQLFLWSPSKRKSTIKYTIGSIFFSLLAYIFAVALLEAASIRDGDGNVVELMLVDNDTPIKTVLLGTTSNYVFTYDYDTKSSVIYYVEAVSSIKTYLREKSSSEEENTEQSEQSDDKIEDSSPPE